MTWPASMIVRKLSPEQVAEVRVLRNEGLSYGKLALRFKLSKSTLHYMCGNSKVKKTYKS